jgi:tetratricopeptide (TPR) repeat protein
MHPFEKLRSGVVNPLWSGRLRQFEGRFAGQGDGPLSTDPNDGAGPTGSAGQEGAKASYLSARMLLSDLVGKDIPDEFKDRYEALQQRAQLMKGHATYWLGLISLEEQKYDLAEYYFDECLKNWPQGRWQSAATFALARSYEASGRTDKAIEKYQELRGLAALGARLRAKRLGAVTPDAGDQEPTKEETDAADDGEGTPPEKDPETE